MPHEEWYRRFKSACRIGKYSKISSCVPARPSVCVPSHTSYVRPRFRSLNEVTPTWRVRSCQRDGPFVARKRGVSRSRDVPFVPASLLSPDYRWENCARRPPRPACFFFPDFNSSPSCIHAKMWPVTTGGAWLTAHGDECLTLRAPWFHNYFVRENRTVRSHSLWRTG